MSPYLTRAVLFSVGLLFDLITILCLLRLLLQVLQVEYHNPVSQALIRITDLPLSFVRRLLPAWRGVDWASLLGAFLAQSVIQSIKAAFVVGGLPSAPGILTLTVASIVELTVHIFIFVIFFRILLTWLGLDRSHRPFAVIMAQLSAPLLEPIRRRIPPLGGLDLSPLVALVVLQLALFLIVAPLADYGHSLVLGPGGSRLLPV